ncbi:MAG: YfiR family protein [Bacteroidales bacterium]|nr:YfiR family protein [Bacteroidales bacterium]
MRKVFLLLVFVLAGNYALFAQTEVSKAQAFFIYNFSRLVKWPAIYTQGDFVIGIYGNSPTFQELSMLTKGKKVGIQNYMVKKFNSLNELSACHILLIATDKTADIKNINARVKDSHCLIISEKEGMNPHGTAIDFLVVDNKLRFTMNVENAEKYDLVVSRSLRDMALVN